MSASVPGTIAHPMKWWLCAIVMSTALPLAAWAAPACVAPNGGIGGTGAPADKGGIGGTGAPAEHGGLGGTGAKESPARGGIGGTGQRAEGGIGGTGIVGTITGFGSVCVNGLEVQYDRSTPVSVNGLPARSDSLAIGQVVAIDASGTGVGLAANNISILNALEGPVTQVHADIGVLYVMGQRVRTATDTHLAGIASLGEARPGLPVRVSGYRNAADEVVASRIEAVGTLPEASIIGTVTNERSGPLAVSGLPVRSSAPPAPSGSEALVRGTWDGERLNAASVRRDPSLPFAGRVDRVVVEGLVLKREGTRQLTVSGFDVTLSAGSVVDGGDIGEAQEGRRIRITGRLGQGRHVTADHIQLMHHSRMGQPMSQMGHGDQDGGRTPMPMGSPGMGSPGSFGSSGGMSPSGSPMGGGGMGRMR